MKTTITSLILVIVALCTFAQTPQSFNYQAVLRDASGNILANQNIEIQVDILQGSASGSAIFSENHSTTTNNFGLVNLTVGSISSTNFSSIDWTDGPFFIQISVDGTVMGTSQLLSVPFAMHAITVENDAVEDDDADPENEIQVLSINADTIFLSSGGFAILPPETDPAFTNWDKSSGITISESQISDLQHFTGDSITGNETAFEDWDKNADDDFTAEDETDPVFSSSLAAAITAEDTARWASNNYTQNELQNLKLENQQLSISGGNTIDLSEAYYIADSSATNELQDISLNGTQLSISKGSTVDLAPLQDGTGTDNQTISLDGNQLVISNGNRIYLPYIRTEGDSNPHNEIQTLSIANDTISLSRKGGQVKLPAETDPLFTDWDKSTGIKITESQITDLDHFTNADETDPVYATDSASLKNTIAKNKQAVIDTASLLRIDLATKTALADTATLIHNETAQNKQAIIDTVANIRADMLTSEIDPVFGASVASAITSADTASWNRDTSATNEIELPSQTGNAGKYLTTDGINTSWDSIPAASDLLSIGTANGLSLSNQHLSLATATTSSAGALSSSDKTKLNKIASANTTTHGKYSTAMGYKTTASGEYGSTAMGYKTTANGKYSTAMGYETTASGQASTAMGNSTKASEDYSTAMGNETTASGQASTAMGYGTTASGYYSTAMGYGTTASGVSSTAMGAETTASGQYGSTAMGNGTTASGFYSTAMGYNTNAKAEKSTAMGAGTTASGVRSLAMGTQTTASGLAATAMGYKTIASGEYSTAMGNYASANKDGSFVYADNSSTTQVEANYENIFKVRASGGVTFYTNSTCTSGGYLSPGGSAWYYVSDSTKKENFLDANGEYFLESISKMKLGSWNYKSQRSTNLRHYGAMAQEVYRYFGKDELGTIGCDTLLNTGDIDGIMMIGIQALEKRSTDAKEKIAALCQQNEELKQIIENLQNANTALKAEKDTEVGELKAENVEIKQRLSELEALVEKALGSNTKLSEK